MSEYLRRNTLESGVWLLGAFKFASLRVANNKLDMPIALRYACSRRPLIARMAELVEIHEPDAIWGVPNGGQEFAEELSDVVDLPVIGLKVIGRGPDGKKVFGFESQKQRDQAKRYPRKVGIEDLTTEFTSTNAVLTLPELADGTVAMVAGCRRGTPDIETPPSGMPVSWAFEFQTPHIITKDHPLYVEYGHLAIGDFVEM